MRIIHCCLSCFYIDGRNYQENELIRVHVKNGHEVLVIASTEIHTDKGDISYCKPNDYIGDEGARVIRIPYRKIFPHYIALRLRFYPRVYRIISEYNPDAILFHGTCAAEIITVASYVKNKKNVIFYVDSHEDKYNSARGFISKEILHKLFYGYCIRKALPEIKKIMCISIETIDFVEETYSIPKNKLEFMPLGGCPIKTKEYNERRNRVRDAMQIEKNSIVILQSGKQTRNKKLIESIKAFKSANIEGARFYIAGVLQDDIKEEVIQLINNDNRICYVGWKNVEELTDLLCATDIYIQPGTQSVTMQHSLCCHCAVAIDDVKSHKIYINGNGWLINENNTILNIMKSLNINKLKEMGECSYKFACEMLDYSVQADRVLK